MAEPAGKAPKPVAPNQVASTGPAFPPTKAQTYGSTLPTYRPQPPSRRPRRRRGCCCRCCAWTACLVLSLLFLTALAGGIFYLIYRPRSPSFSLSSVKFSAFNVTAGGDLTSKLDLNVTAENKNTKVGFVYDDVAVAAWTGDVAVGRGSAKGFAHVPRERREVKVAAAARERLSAAAAAELRKKTVLPLRIEIETKAAAKVGSVTTRKIRVRVTCHGADVAVPGGKTVVKSTQATCKVKLRVKIWKWYL